MREAGKGSKQRPRQVSYKSFEEAWDHIFKGEKTNDNGSRTTDHGAAGGRNDKRPAAQGGDVRTPRESGN